MLHMRDGSEGFAGIPLQFTKQGPWSIAQSGRRTRRCSPRMSEMKVRRAVRRYADALAENETGLAGLRDRFVGSASPRPEKPRAGLETATSSAAGVGLSRSACTSRLVPLLGWPRCSTWRSGVCQTEARRCSRRRLDRPPRSPIGAATTPRRRRSAISSAASESRPRLRAERAAGHR